MAKNTPPQYKVPYVYTQEGEVTCRANSPEEALKVVTEHLLKRGLKNLVIGTPEQQ
jgi:hypothetical protein